MEELKKLMTDMQEALGVMRKRNDERFEAIEKKSTDPLALASLKKAEDAIAKMEEKQAEIVTAMRRREDERKADPNAVKPELVEYKAAFNEWVRDGGKDPSLGSKVTAAQKKAVEAKAMSVGSNPDGGFLVPVDTSGRMVKKIYETSAMRQWASVQSISTDKLEGDYDLDEGSAQWEDEQGTGAADGSTPTVGKWTIQTHVLKSRVRATQQLLDDAQVDVEAWLADKNAGKQERTEALAFILGNGVGKPRGILTYDAGTNYTPSLKQIEQIHSGTSGAFQKADQSDSADFFLRLQYALKDGYLPGAVWGLSRAGRMAARVIKNAQGNYVWVDQFMGGQGTQIQPATLFGFPVAVMNDLPAIAANSLSVLFGNLREAYQIVDRQGIRVLRDPYTAEPFVKFITSRRVGGAVVNFEAVKIGKLAA